MSRLTILGPADLHYHRTPDRYSHRTAYGIVLLAAMVVWIVMILAVAAHFGVTP